MDFPDYWRSGWRDGVGWFAGWLVAVGLLFMAGARLPLTRNDGASR